MRWLIDSNVWIEAIEWAGFSSITRLEILGFPKITANDEVQFLKILRQFHEVPVSSEVIDEAIRIRKGFRIKTPDALIAASALATRADLVTRNIVDFAQIPGLIVLSPDAMPAR